MKKQIVLAATLTLVTSMANFGLAIAQSADAQLQQASQEWQSLGYAIAADKKCDLMDDTSSSAAQAKWTELNISLSNVTSVPQDGLGEMSKKIESVSCDQLKQNAYIKNGLDLAKFQVQFNALVWLKYLDEDNIMASFQTCDDVVTYSDYLSIESQFSAHADKLKTHPNYSEFEKHAQSIANQARRACSDSISFYSAIDSPLFVVYKSILKNSKSK